MEEIISAYRVISDHLMHRRSLKTLPSGVYRRVCLVDGCGKEFLGKTKKSVAASLSRHKREHTEGATANCPVCNAGNCSFCNVFHVLLVVLLLH
jgi:hypothetical protein